MGKTFDALTDEHREWIAAQHMFFVASAPLSGDGHVNLSPKGYDTFRVIDSTTVVYLDLTGSGIETVAHLQENGRITVMFCAFEGKPRILRMYGTGTVIPRGAPGYDELASGFGTYRAARAVIRVDISRVVHSCGYSVPFMSYTGERETLTEWADRKGPGEIEAYWDEKNLHSVDGLPGLVSQGTTT